MSLLNQKSNSYSPVAVNERIKQIADGDGHQGEHEHSRACRRAHCGRGLERLMLRQ